MNADEAKSLIASYRKSWYENVDHIDAHRTSSGASVPRLCGHELVASMLENVDEAHTARTGTGDRFAAAVQDGLINRDGSPDMDIIGGLPKELRAPFVSAGRTVVGDLARADAELKHWREYVRWAQEQATAARATPRASLDHRELQAGEREPGSDDGDDLSPDESYAP